MSAPMISPVLGLTKLGPYPPKGALGEEVHRKTLYLMSPASHSASSGCIFTSIAFLIPAFKNASFHARRPSIMYSLNYIGVVFSSQKRIGFTGSEISSSGSFFCKSHL